MKYKDWLQQWLMFSKPLLKVRTFERYAKFIDNQIIPKLGGFELSALSAPVLQRFATEISEKYAANTVKCIVLLIKRSLKSAQQMNVVRRQYGDGIRFKAVSAREIRCLSLGDQRKLEDYIFTRNEHKLFGILLSLYSGLRIGELLALKWEDIDFTNDILSVTKSCHDTYSDGKYVKYIDSPKTPSSKRKIPLPKQLVPYLKALKKSNVSGFLIEGKGGKAISVRSYENTFKVVMQRLDLPYTGFHCLRHTFATRALECGMDVKTLSEILGHKNAAITLNCYTHSMPEHKSAMMNKLGKMLQLKP